MKAAIVAAAAAVLTGGASAGHAHARHAHDLFKKRGLNDTEVCQPGCTTIYSTITGTPGLWTPPAAPSTIYANTTSAYPTVTPPAPVPTTSTTPVVIPTTTLVVIAPTPVAQTCETPGTYTFPATTMVVTETQYVCGASTTSVPAGTHTLGGVTTVVETATTIVCPYATTATEAGVVTSVISTTTYVCPSAGTYTIGPITTVVADETVIVVPAVETYQPGTYTAPEIVTVVETATVIYCPFASSTDVPVAAPTTVAAATTAVVPAAVPTTTSQAAQATSTGSTAKLGGGKNLGITYTPYSSDGTCKTADEVTADITAIKAAGINTIRVYSTDCDTLPNVGGACRAQGVKMITGIFIDLAGCENDSPTVEEQITALKDWAQWDLVAMVVVGNEAMFNNYCNPTQLRDLIVRVKTEFGAAGYTGLYTTTDVVSAWIGLDVSMVCDVIDVVGANAHAYFNAGTTPDQAGDFVAGQLKIVEDVCSKEGYILESGWPKQGICYGVACPGETEQATAIASIQSVIGDKTVLFSYRDDQWKKPGDCGCERSWGCGNLLGISS